MLGCCRRNRDNDHVDGHLFDSGGNLVRCADHGYSAQALPCFCLVVIDECDRLDQEVGRREHLPAKGGAGIARSDYQHPRAVAVGLTASLQAFTPDPDDDPQAAGKKDVDSPFDEWHGPRDALEVRNQPEQGYQDDRRGGRCLGDAEEVGHRDIAPEAGVCAELDQRGKAEHDQHRSPYPVNRMIDAGCVEIEPEEQRQIQRCKWYRSLHTKAQQQSAPSWNACDRTLE